MKLFSKYIVLISFIIAAIYTAGTIVLGLIYGVRGVIAILGGTVLLGIVWCILCLVLADFDEYNMLRKHNYEEK